MSDYYSSVNDPSAVKEISERYGFCLVKGLFTAAEVAQLEETITDEKRKIPGLFPDLYSVPALKWLVTNERVVSLAKALLGPEITYYRETNVAYEDQPGTLTRNPYTELHCDARGGRDVLSAAWAGPPDQIYSAYRFAVYFRNYRDYSGGLKVAVGSHVGDIEQFRKFHFPKNVTALPRVPMTIGSLFAKIPTPPFELYNVPNVPGDLVIFNLRTFHSAGAIRFKDRPTLSILPAVENGLREHPDVLAFSQPIPPGSRNAVFLDFGSASEAVDLYVKWRAHEAYSSVPHHVDSSASPDFQIRSDKLILALAMRLSAETSIDAASPPAQQLLALCRTHREYSPYHPLFDAADFREKDKNDSRLALESVLQSTAIAHAAYLAAKAKADSAESA